jgi:hypothetical protein
MDKTIKQKKYLTIVVVLGILLCVSFLIWIRNYHSVLLKQRNDITTMPTSKYEAPISVRFEEYPIKDTSKGDVSIRVFLTGPEAYNVTGTDFVLGFDENMASIVSIAHGPFFESPMIIKNELSKNLFSVAEMPSVQKPIRDETPLHIIEYSIRFLRNGRVNFEVDPSTVFYVRDIGSVTYHSSPIELSKNRL